ncbi:hypothetical protein LEMLEM_LOCUS9089, partial [Lemmus lemmus]
QKGCKGVINKVSQTEWLQSTAVSFLSLVGWRHLPSYLPQGTDEWHLQDDSTRDAFPATPLAGCGPSSPLL